MKRTDIIITDLRSIDKPTPVDEVPIGAIVAYVTDAGDRRGVVIERTAKTLTVLDGNKRERLIGARYASVKMLAASAEAYTRRAAEQAQELRYQQGWCGVPNQMIRDLNNTPHSHAPTFVIASSLSVYALQPTPMTLRRKDLSTVVQASFSPRYGEFGSRDFKLLQTPTMKIDLKVVDAVPEL